MPAVCSQQHVNGVHKLEQWQRQVDGTHRVFVNQVAHNHRVNHISQAGRQSNEDGCPQKTPELDVKRFSFCLIHLVDIACHLLKDDVPHFELEAWHTFTLVEDCVPHFDLVKESETADGGEHTLYIVP